MCAGVCVLCVHVSQTDFVVILPSIKSHMPRKRFQMGKVFYFSFLCRVSESKQMSKVFVGAFVCMRKRADVVVMFLCVVYTCPTR